jgi:hypothetical protein
LPYLCSDKTSKGETKKEMKTTNNNPILRAVNSAIGSLKIEGLLCEGHAVNYYMLKEALGDRMIIEKRRLCMSHVRSLAASIIDFKAVVIPLTVERNGNNYILTDGYHRLAALEMVKKSHPDMYITITVITL